MKFISKEDLSFWKKNIMKGFVMIGFTFFSTALTIGTSSALKNSLVAGGMLIFVEAMRKYNINIPKNKRGMKNYSFLI